MAQQVEDELASARGDLIKANIALYKALGGGWTEEDSAISLAGVARDDGSHALGRLDRDGVAASGH